MTPGNARAGFNAANKNWQLLTVTGSGGSSRVYIDGQLVGTAGAQVNEPIRMIGDIVDANHKFTDYFDEVRIDVIGLIRDTAGDFQVEHVRGVG